REIGCPTIAVRRFSASTLTVAGLLARISGLLVESPKSARFRKISAENSRSLEPKELSRQSGDNSSRLRYFWPVPFGVSPSVRLLAALRFCLCGHDCETCRCPSILGVKLSQRRARTGAAHPLQLACCWGWPSRS